MNHFLIVSGAAGVVCSLAALVALGATAASERWWGVAVSCLGAFAVILMLLLVIWEYQDSFWEGR